MNRIKLTISNSSKKNLQEKQRTASQLGDATILMKIAAILGYIDGLSCAGIALQLGVTAETIRKWVKDFILRGHKSLIVKTSPGRPAKLTKTQKNELVELISGSPTACGYPGECWRSPMIQHLIQKKFGITFSVAYIAQLLKNLGLSYQKAKFESAYLNEEKRKNWLENTWPEVLNKAKKTGAYILFGDEASFPQWGSLSYTWAKKGVTPQIKTSGKRKGYKVFGLIEYFSGQFFCQAQEGRLDSTSYLHFLEEVLEQTNVPLILIQDGARYHTSKEVKEFLLDNDDRITAYQLPSYSPDFNPIEGLWKKIKQAGTHLHYFPTFEALKDKVDLMLGLFENESREVLKLFGFYQKMEPKPMP